MNRKQAEVVVQRFEAGGELVALRHEKGLWLTRGQGERKGCWVQPVFARSTRKVGTLVIDPAAPHLAEVDWE